MRRRRSRPHRAPQASRRHRRAPRRCAGAVRGRGQPSWPRSCIAPSSNHWTSSSRARKTRDFTVPTGTPSTSAASWYGCPNTSTSTKASRRRGDSDASAARTSVPNDASASAAAGRSLAATAGAVRPVAARRRRRSERWRTPRSRTGPDAGTGPVRHGRGRTSPGSRQPLARRCRAGGGRTARRAAGPSA